jgi:hypothetical protein
METVRGQERELREQLHHENQSPGVRALASLAAIERDKALASWRRASGDDMVRFQSRFNSMQDIIDMINKRPEKFDRA